MACAPEWVTAYVDGELDREVGRVLERHLLGCGICSTQAGAERRLRLELRSLRDPALPAALERRFVAPQRARLD